MTVQIFQGDCREVLKTLADASVDSIVTDPPYHLTTGKKGGTGPASVNLNTPQGRARVTTGFMGQQWDGGVVLDPFMGSGSTLKAAELEGFSAIGIELSPECIAIARRRIAADAPLFAEVLA